MQSAKERIREALDNDTPISDSFPTELDLIGRVEAVAETLLLFLSSLQNGVIAADMWIELEKSIMSREKTKTTHLLSLDDERMQILDILTASPAHSTSFTFITTMLVKVLAELTTDHKAREGSRKKREEAFASMFAEVVIRAPVVGNARERRVSMGRRKRVIGVFIEES